MSGSETDVKSEWVGRVLGVQVPGPSGSQDSPGAFDWPSIRSDFEAASDAVDKQIAALQSALKQSDEDVLQEIAQFGMNGITGNHKVRLMAAIMEIGGGDGESVAKAGPMVVKIAQEFKQYLDSDERVEVCDDNPFNVPVSIRATLGGALGRMAESLSRGLKQ